MVAFGGMERTEKQWRKLLEGAGLKIERFVKPEPAGRGGRGQIPECVIESVVAEDDEGKGKREGGRGERALT